MSETMPTLGAPIRGIRAVMPAYNEQGNLAEVVQATLEALHDVTPTFELVIVNDGSGDGTRRIADECAATHPHVQVVHHPRRRGPGAAWRTGIDGSTSQYTLFIDADRQYDPLELERIAHWGDTYDLVSGYRIARADGAGRRMLGLLFRLSTRVVLQVKARDVTCGFLLIRTSVLQRMRLESDGMIIHAELRRRAQQMGARTREVGVHHFPRRRGKSTGARPGTLVKALREMVALKRRLAEEERVRETDRGDPTAITDASPTEPQLDPHELGEPPVAGAS